VGVGVENGFGVGAGAGAEHMAKDGKS